MDWLKDTQWLLWLAAALIAGLIEIVSLDFFFIMIAGGALVAAVAAALDAPVSLQVIIFAVSSGALLLGGRPPLKRWAQNTPSVTMNAAALVGRDARVLETVTDRAGLVKLHGEVWTARVAPGHTQLEVGSDVLVIRIDGATAVVAPEPAPPATHFLEGNPTS
jgi:membrane protein implicated in regulation of membrane protease activity